MSTQSITDMSSIPYIGIALGDPFKTGTMADEQK